MLKRSSLSWAAAILGLVTITVFFPDQLPCVLAATVAALTAMAVTGPQN